MRGRRRAGGEVGPRRSVGRRRRRTQRLSLGDGGGESRGGQRAGGGRRRPVRARRQRARRKRAGPAARDSGRAGRVAVRGDGARPAH
eukprot:2908169-Pyramimonas_sp.AAC.1